MTGQIGWHFPSFIILLNELCGGRHRGCLPLPLGMSELEFLLTKIEKNRDFRPKSGKNWVKYNKNRNFGTF